MDDSAAEIQQMMNEVLKKEIEEQRMKLFEYKNLEIEYTTDICGLKDELERWRKREGELNKREADSIKNIEKQEALNRHRVKELQTELDKEKKKTVQLIKMFLVKYDPENKLRSLREANDELVEKTIQLSDILQVTKERLANKSAQLQACQSELQEGEERETRGKSIRSTTIENSDLIFQEVKNKLENPLKYIKAKTDSLNKKIFPEMSRRQSQMIQGKQEFPIQMTPLESPECVPSPPKKARPSDIEYYPHIPERIPDLKPQISSFDRRRLSDPRPGRSDFYRRQLSDPTPTFPGFVQWRPLHITPKKPTGASRKTSQPKLEASDFVPMKSPQPVPGTSDFVPIKSPQRKSGTSYFVPIKSPQRKSGTSYFVPIKSPQRKSGTLDVDLMKSPQPVPGTSDFVPIKSPQRKSGTLDVDLMKSPQPMLEILDFVPIKSPQRKSGTLDVDLMKSPQPVPGTSDFVPIKSPQPRRRTPGVSLKESRLPKPGELGDILKRLRHPKPKKLDVDLKKSRLVKPKTYSVLLKKSPQPKPGTSGVVLKKSSQPKTRSCVARKIQTSKKTPSFRL